VALIVISGNRRGLGAALTNELEARGHRVVGCSSGAEPPNRVNVASSGEVRAWAQTVLARHGPPDVLINNAGVVTPVKPLWEQLPEDFETIVSVNVGGVFNMISAFVPAMVSRGSGVIVNVSSGWGRSTSPRVALYCTTKWAVEGMTRALAQELPKGMAAVTLDPGTINTEMLQTVLAGGARFYPSPETWCPKAADLILAIGASQNGKALTVP
jgi:NAD(P)-dependent dehydrogenase (short-subunit alcohol dehydrogenase family)